MFALVCVWWGWQFTSFGWDQTSEIADLPMWLIFIAWPIAGMTWLIYLGEQFAGDFRIVTGRVPA
jgi:TRAP-type C4-dicarboxylate transport system permease small subunit